MPVSPIQALQAAQHGPTVAKNKPDLLIAGATGALGHAVLQRLVGVHRYAHTRVLIREPMQQGMRMVSLLLVDREPATWPVPELVSDVAVLMFEPPNLFYERERALWTPLPEQLPAVAAWLRRSGVRTLAVVLPHAQGTLPESLKRGLATLDEQDLAMLGFERLIIVRSAQKPAAVRQRHPLQALAHWMLGIFQFMVPAAEQPVRPSKLAVLVDALLQHAPVGTHVLAPEQVWQWTQLPVAQMEQQLAAHWQVA